MNSSVSKKELEKIYLNSKLTIKEICKKLNISETTFYWLRQQYNIPKRLRGNQLDLRNKKFGKLLVYRFSHKTKIDNRPYWKCICDCGKHLSVRYDHLLDGGTQSCGCVNWQKGSKNRNWKGYKDISGQYWKRIEHGAKKRQLKFEISKKYIWDLFEKQNKKCIYSGLPIKFDGCSNGSASIDRIDSSKGYIVGNIQIVHKKINMMKQNFSDIEFKNYCILVSQNCKF